MNKQTKRYIKAVRRQIPCGWRRKAALMESFLRSIQNYAEENDSVSDADLTDAFGTPEEMAQTLREHLSAADIQKHRRRKVILRVLFVAVVLAIILWSIHILFFANAPVDVVKTTIIE